MSIEEISVFNKEINVVNMKHSALAICQGGVIWKSENIETLSMN